MTSRHWHLGERASRAAVEIKTDDLSDPIGLIDRSGYDRRTFFQNATFSDLDFRKSDLRGVSFRGARLYRIKVYDDQAASIAASGPLVFADKSLFARPNLDGTLEYRPEFTDHVSSPLEFQAFDTEDELFFGGRDVEARVIFDLLVEHNLVGIIGASGSGKSSLANAGVYSLIKENCPNWIRVSFRIGSEPIESMFYAINAELTAEERSDGPIRLNEFLDQLANDSDALFGYLEVINFKTGKLPVLFIDQWEELYTLCEDNDGRDIFLRNIIAAVQKGAVKILLMVRSDFYEALENTKPPFFELLRPNLIEIDPININDLRIAVEKFFENMETQIEAGLVDRLLVDVGKDQTQFPILQLVLYKLWENRSLEHNYVTLETYDRLGGIGMIFGTHADNTIGRLTPLEKQTARLILPTLVQDDKLGNSVRQRVAIAQFNEEQKLVLRKLSEPHNRLVMISRANEVGNPQQEIEYVELIHDVFIHFCSTLQMWLSNDFQYHHQLRRLRAYQREYINNDRDPSYLLGKDEVLEDAMELINIYGKENLDIIYPYIQASYEKRVAEKGVSGRIVSGWQKLTTKLRKKAE